MADLICDDTPSAFFTHAEDVVSPGPRLIYRVGSSRVLRQLMWQLYKRNLGCGGFYHPTSGIAAVFLDLLRDPHTREDCLRDFSPGGLSDEPLARVMAIHRMIVNLARKFEAGVNEQCGQFRREKRNAQTLHELGQDYEVYSRLACCKAGMHLEDAASVGARLIVTYAGWSLERDFCLRAPRLLSRLVAHDLGLTKKMTERQARYLCGW